LGALMGRLPADAEAALLGAAAASSQARRAGTLPPVTEAPMPAPCPPETLPACGPRVAQGVALMLGGKHREALPEMLTALAGTGRIAPVSLLPDLLKQGRQATELRAAILSALGNRGRWLAAQNRDWAWADQLILETAESPEQVWAEGGREARLSALTSLRQSDPAGGLALLQSTWAGETADDRAAFIAALDSGLCEADEAFLEAALGDRGKDVRRAALLRLGRLPDSAYARRMVARVQPLLVGKGNLLGGFSLGIALPAAYDKDMERDGISKDPPNAVVGFPKMGDKAWWLCQMVGAVPLGYWTQTWRRSPAEITGAADKTEWAAPLRQAWGGAVRRQPDVDWFSALLGGGLDSHADIFRLGGQSHPSLAALPAAGLERLILEQLRPATRDGAGGVPVPLHDDHLPLLQSHTQPWSAALSRAVVESAQQRMTSGAGRSGGVWNLAHELERSAFLMPAHLATEFAQGWPEADTIPEWRQSVARFVATLRFRRDLLLDISKETRP